MSAEVADEPGAAGDVAADGAEALRERPHHHVHVRRVAALEEGGLGEVKNGSGRDDLKGTR